MEPRKIQRVGASTLAVSLPSDWVKRTGVQRGDIIYFDQDDVDVLKLITSSNLEKEKPTNSVNVDADLCKTPQMLSRILVGNYILGRDVIRIISKTRLQSNFLEAIRNTITGFMGIAIMEETPNQVVLQSSIDITKFPIHTLIRRLFIIASTMYQEAVDAFLKSESGLAKDTISRQVEADSMFWVIIRLLDSAQRDKDIADRIEVQNPIQILWYRIAAQCLSRIASWSEKIAAKVVALEPRRELIGERLITEIQALSDNTYSLIEQSISSLFSSDIKLANQVMDNYNSLQDTEEQIQEAICSHAYLREKSFSVNSYFKGKNAIESCMISQISFILWSIRRTAELGAEIAELAITRTLSKDTKICQQINTDNVFQ
jgi:phosphate uptake regulator